MNLKQLTQSLLVLVVCLYPQIAKADHHEPGEVEAAIRQFYGHIAAGQFEEAFAHMQLGARGYLPFGVLSEMPDENTRKLVVAQYSKGYEEGARITMRPQYIKVTTHGSVAIATFLVEGTIKGPEDEEPQRELNRASVIWNKTDSGWKMLHWHISAVDTEEDD